MEMNITDTATALRMESGEMHRPNNVALCLFLMVAMAEQSSTAIVTVFIPPAVPTGEPPMDISRRDTKEDAFVRFSCGIEAKPAVLVVTDWNRDV